MSTVSFIEIDRKRYPWTGFLEVRVQRLAHAKAVRPALFALRDHYRATTSQPLAGRYLQPSLVDCRRQP
jgi:hypothetical protein